MPTLRATRLLSSCLLATVSFMPCALAESINSRSIQGAWVEANIACEKAFTLEGKTASFRRPIDIFVPALIVSGSSLKTPGASCRIRRISDAAVKGRKEVSLSCATGVAVDDVKVQLSIALDGALYRYADDQDSVGRRYERCSH